MRPQYLVLACLLAWAIMMPLAAFGGDTTDLVFSSDFENEQIGSRPTGWSAGGTRLDQASLRVVEDHPDGGSRCLEIRNDGDGGGGNILRSFDATPYRNQRIRLRASVKTDFDSPQGRAQLWLRVDLPGRSRGFLDNMGDRPITSKAWRTFEIDGDVSERADNILIGLLVFEQGKVWLDDVTVEVIGPAIGHVEAPRPLTDRGLTNLTALAKLIGYIRQFHPSDRSAETDWDTFTIKAVRKVEDASSDKKLIERLFNLFEPIAPTIVITSDVTQIGQPGITAIDEPPMTTYTGYVYWDHFGFGQKSNPKTGGSLYNSRRVYARDGEAMKEDIPTPGSAVVAQLCDGVYARIPLAVYHDVTLKTLPIGHPLPPQLSAGSPRPPKGNDRATRLAAIILAWNVFQHFYLSTTFPCHPKAQL